MNSQRKIYIIFVLITGLITTHIKTMESQKNISNRELLLFGTGAVFGAGCVGLFCWYNNHQKEFKFKSLEDKMEKIKEDNHILRKAVENQKELLEEETTRLDQTRGWVMEDRKKQDDQQITNAIKYCKTTTKIKNLKERVDALENQEKFYSCHSSSSAE